MKKILALTLALVMALSLTSCALIVADAVDWNEVLYRQSVGGQGSSAPSGSQNNRPSTTPVVPSTDPSTPPETETSNDNVTMGTYSEATNTYINEFVGLGFKPGPDWTAYNEEQMAELNSKTMDMLTDEAMKEAIQSGKAVQVFFAQKNDTSANTGITVENIGKVNGVFMSESEYIDSGMRNADQQFGGAGLTIVNSETGMYTLAGVDHASVKMIGTSSGVTLYIRIVAIKVGSYVATVNAISGAEDQLDSILSCYFAV